MIKKEKILFPVHIDAVPVRVALRRPYLWRETLYWPVLRMKDWINILLSRCPQILLGGYQLDQAQQWKTMFSGFWTEFKTCSSGHPVYSSNLPLDHCVPYFLHGDEGRTLRSRAMMIESFQPVISRKGMKVSNESGFLGRSGSYIFACGVLVVSLVMRCHKCGSHHT